MIDLTEQNLDNSDQIEWWKNDSDLDLSQEEYNRKREQFSIKCYSSGDG